MKTFIILFSLISMAQPFPVRATQDTFEKDKDVPSLETMEGRLKKVYNICVKNTWNVYSTRVYGMNLYNAEIPFFGRMSNLGLDAIRTLRENVLDKNLNLGKLVCEKEQEDLYAELISMLTKTSDEQGLKDSEKVCLAMCATKIMLKFTTLPNPTTFLGNAKKTLRCGRGVCTEYANLAKSLVSDLGIEVDTSVSMGLLPNNLGFNMRRNAEAMLGGAVGHSFIQVKLENGNWYYAEPLEALHKTEKACAFYSKDPKTLFVPRFESRPFDTDGVLKGSRKLNDAIYMNLDPHLAVDQENSREKIIDTLNKNDIPYLITPTVQDGIYRISTIDGDRYIQTLFSMKHDGLFSFVSNPSEEKKLVNLIEEFLSNVIDDFEEEYEVGKSKRD